MAENKKVLTTENLVALKELLDETYQEKLFDGASVKTINGESILGSGDIKVAADVEEIQLKTINGQSIQGKGNLELINAKALAENWAANYEYVAGDLVSKNNQIYACLEDHTSSNFNDDLNNGYWEVISLSAYIKDNMEDLCASLFAQYWEESITDLLNQEL